MTDRRNIVARVFVRTTVARLFSVLGYMFLGATILASFEKARSGAFTNGDVSFLLIISILCGLLAKAAYRRTVTTGEAQ